MARVAPNDLRNQLRMGCWPSAGHNLAIARFGSGHRAASARAVEPPHAAAVGDPDPPPGEAAEEHRTKSGRRSIRKTDNTNIVIHRAFKANNLLALVPGSNRNYKKPALLGRLRIGYPRMSASGESSTTMHRLLHASGSHPIPTPYDPKDTASRGPTTIVNPKSQFRTCPSDHGITDSACKNQLVVVSVQYDPFNTYIPIRSTTIGKSRVAKDPITMHTSWRSNSDITSVTR
ncbi:NADP-dependent D-sorbitol-6-phosphate dehydrogenase-like [Dorcoceras hygrometricum]|uniref:NADP-dependent D-sorbitol-6-phosphate dehydrogenase-like n=1 Tax=Dorcoceras hygrometricum TaxID=472368 RepID=A0A2Z7B7N4_9LAMI|nr:NADP-dependent D-sorbitol-6-phosphate dehydrogenase-like [Dorcoceras hygrometricum]